MNFDHRQVYNINPFWLVLFTVISLSGCHSLPPYTPSAGLSIDFNPQAADWRVGSVDQAVRGDWYGNGTLRLILNGDTLIVDGRQAQNWDVWKFGEQYYRLIYALESRFYALYLNVQSADSLNLAFADGSALSNSDAANLQLINVWYPLTANLVWFDTGLPSELFGFWHEQGSSQAFSFDNQVVTINSVAWNITAVQSNYNLERILLERGGVKIAVYFRNLSANSVEILVSGTTNDILDRYGNVDGDWKLLAPGLQTLRTQIINS